MHIIELFHLYLALAGHRPIFRLDIQRIRENIGRRQAFLRRIYAEQHSFNVICVCSRFSGSFLSIKYQNAYRFNKFVCMQSVEIAQFTSKYSQHLSSGRCFERTTNRIIGIRCVLLLEFCSRPKKNINRVPLAIQYFQVCFRVATDFAGFRLHPIHKSIT